jgi:hypothetical protein
MAADPRVARVDEPWIGVHLGLSVGSVVGVPDDRRIVDARKGWPDYLFAEESRTAWAGPLRHLLLARLATAAAGHRWVAIKEPNSEAADLILSVLPRSRMIFLLRDGRDVVDSLLAGVSKGGWVLELLEGSDPVENRLAYIRETARAWLRRTDVVQSAFEAHNPELRLQIRYEDLLDDPVLELGRIAGWLGLDGERLRAAAESLRFERMPDRGPGRFVRSASPGSWRKNLSKEEQAVLTEILAPRLASLGYR